MPNKKRRTTSPSRCPLTNSPELRQKAKATTAAIQGNFPPGLSQPALRALAEAGYTRLEQMHGVSQRQLLALHGIGPKAIDALRAGLRQHGLQLGK